MYQISTGDYCKLCHQSIIYQVFPLLLFDLTKVRQRKDLFIWCVADLEHKKVLATV